MKRRTSAFLLVMLTLSLVVAGGNGQDKPPTPAEQYAALKKEYHKTPGTRVPSNDDERLRFVGRAYKHHHAVALKFLELAEKYPNDPIALDHLASDKLGPLCQRVSWGFCKEYESFLRAVLAKNPHKNVQATACLSLGRFLNNRLQRLDLCKEQPELAREFGGLYGKDYLAELLRQNRDKAIQDIEAVFEQAARKYSDVKLADGDMVAERAKAELFGIRNLRVGKEAPDIDGEDEDGKRFKLSDYRGKVVLLDFWSFV